MEPFLNICNLTAGYGNDFHIREIGFSLPKGTFTGITGPNGSGKTTLFRAITGELAIKEGSVFLNNRELGKMRINEKARSIAVVSMEPEAASITVEDYVLMGRYPYHKPFQFFESEADAEIAQHFMEVTGIAQLRNKELQHLSGGQRQLAGIARALSQQPELLLLDEPTSHLDIRHQLMVMNLLQRLNEELGLSIMMIIHDLNLTSEYCENIIMMKNGRLHAHGTPQKVLTYKNIENVYETIVITQANPLSGKPVVILVSEKNLKKEDNFMKNSGELTTALNFSD